MKECVFGDTNSGGGKIVATLAVIPTLQAAGHTIQPVKAGPDYIDQLSRGYRVDMLQFMRGSVDCVEDVRGEYKAVDVFLVIIYKNAAYYGWYGLHDGSDEDDYEAEVQVSIERTRELVAASESMAAGFLLLNTVPDASCHMHILDEICYVVDHDLLATDDVLALVNSKPDVLELALTRGHDTPSALYGSAGFVTNVRNEKNPIGAGQGVRKGTEF